MLISIDWIRDFADVPKIDPREIMRRFTLATAEVEDVISVGEHLEKISVAEIVKIEKHPEADKLNLVTFNYGGSDTKRVVCGAPNVKEGMKVPYAPLGTTFPGGFTLEPKKIRGILSEGMLCSEAELGFSEEASGLMELPKDAKLGTTMLDFLNDKKDVLLDVDNKSLTHRPDLWGVYGIAREFAAIFETKLNDTFSDKWKKKLESNFTKEKSPVIPRLEGESSCLGYYGLSLKDVEVKESPDWMQRRLRALGLRPINNIVDISNYVMLELGIPLHIFDRDLIKGDEVVIKMLGKKDKFVTLDEEERQLLETDTIICDSKEPLVIGGIMGGLSSGVTEKTTNIFIETANWKPALVRKTSNRLGLRTDSSQRYEKSLDTALLERTMLRTLELVLEMSPNAKVIGKPEYDGEKFWEKKPLVIKTSISKINSVLGIEVPKERILSIFKFLDFNVSEKKGNLEVTVPSYRATKDVEFEDDLIEEIGRIVGYDHITPQSPSLSISPVKLSYAHKLQREIRDFLVYHGRAFEVMTYPMIGKRLLDKSEWNQDDCFKIINSLSEDHDRMRPSLIPGFLEAAAKNVKNYNQFRFFELGRSYLPEKGGFSKDCNQLAIAFYDKDESCFMSLANTVERLMKSLNLPGELVEKNEKFKNPMVPEKWSGLHPFEFLNIRTMGRINGALLTVHPYFLRSLKVKGHLSLAVLDLSLFEGQKLKDKSKYTPLPKFPHSTFDCTVMVDQNSPVGDILTVLRKKMRLKEIISHKIVTVYDFKDQGKKSVTIRTLFGNPEQTLSGEFIKRTEDMIVDTLNKAGFPLKME